MINALIIEDERTAADSLIRMLELTREPIQVLAVTDSVTDSVEWLRTHPQPDIIFMDIQLKDGNSFSIFDEVKVVSPIVFTTAYDNFLIKAFEQNSIEFLLKPIEEKAVLHTIRKYKSLKEHFMYKYEEVLGKLTDKNKRKRLIAKKGIEYQSIPLEEVAYIFTEHKITFLVTRQEKKFMLDQNLKELEDELDRGVFYRANRKYIVHVDCIKSYKTFDKVKLLLELTTPVSEEIVISQENAPDFKKWISEI
ncbi:MAG: LytTR family DNA-binding domain-containing protein [Ferruginibacter sp.]